MSMTKTLWSINALATELDKDRRTVAKALSNVPPDGHVSGESVRFNSGALTADPISVGGSVLLDVQVPMRGVSRVRSRAKYGGEPAARGCPQG